MTFSLSVSGSRNLTPEAQYYHPITDEEAKAFDKAVADFAAALKAANFHGSISGSRPGTNAEYDARPLVNGQHRDTGNTNVSLGF